MRYLRWSGLLFALAVVLLAGPEPLMAQVRPDSLVAYYPFTGDATDATSGGADGTVYGATLTTDPEGQLDQAYHFDGSSYIQTPLMVQSATGAVSAWVRVDSYQTGYNQLNLVFGQWDNLQLGLGDSSMGADGQWVFRFRDGAGTMLSAIGPLVDVETWVHVAGVWDGVYITLYLDGQSVARTGAVSTAAASGALAIGRHSHAYGQSYWFGTIDDVRIYDRALSSEDILALANMFTGAESRSWGGIKAMYRE